MYGHAGIYDRALSRDSKVLDQVTTAAWQKSKCPEVWGWLRNVSEVLLVMSLWTPAPWASSGPLPTQVHA